MLEVSPSYRSELGAEKPAGGLASIKRFGLIGEEKQSQDPHGNGEANSTRVTQAASTAEVNHGDKTFATTLEYPLFKGIHPKRARLRQNPHYHQARRGQRIDINYSFKGCSYCASHERCPNGGNSGCIHKGDDGALNTPLSPSLKGVWIDRDISWLDFNERVLAEALDSRESPSRAHKVFGNRKFERRRVLHEAPALPTCISTNCNYSKDIRCYKSNNWNTLSCFHGQFLLVCPWRQSGGKWIQLLLRMRNATRSAPERNLKI